MHRLKEMKECLINCVQTQINGNLKNVDTKELGEAIDMIKDLEEAMYYGTITKAMNADKKSSKHNEEEYEDIMYYSPYPPYYSPYMNKRNGKGRMYYNEGYWDAKGVYYDNGTPILDYDKYNKYDKMMPMNPEMTHSPMEVMRDHREGRSPMSRKTYMETKELHSDDTEMSMKELEKYLHELSQDITEMVQKATPDEKHILQQKLALLASKIK